MKNQANVTLLTTELSGDCWCCRAFIGGGAQGRLSRLTGAGSQWAA
jgi:hypothetical protein